jgi:hypothetical protein
MTAYEPTPGANSRDAHDRGLLLAGIELLF